MSLNLPVKGDADKKIGAYLAPLSVSVQDIPNMTVKVRAGGFYNAQNVYVEYIGGNTPALLFLLLLFCCSIISSYHILVNARHLQLYHIQYPAILEWIYILLHKRRGMQSRPHLPHSYTEFLKYYLQQQVPVQHL